MRIANVLLVLTSSVCVDIQFGSGGSGGGPAGCPDECNDGNPCTQDLCGDDGACQHPEATVVTLPQPVGDCADAVCDGTELVSL